MYLIAIAWMYVALMMALAEGFSHGGSWLGAFFTLMIYGVGPVSLLMYLLGTPGRRRLRQRAAALAEIEAREDPARDATPVSSDSSVFQLDQR